MQALEVDADISTDGQVLNLRLPQSCRPWFGSHAKLIMILPDALNEEVRRQQRIEKWQALLKETQALPQASEISEAEIEAEIDAYRSGK